MEIEVLLRATLKEFPNVSMLIKEHDIKKWQTLSTKYANFLGDYVEKANWNILTILIAYNYDFDSAKNLLIYLEDCLKIFPELITSEEFPKNIKSLEEFAFFSFLSELSVARRYKGNGFDIGFNYKYKKLVKGKIKKKDVDLEVTDKSGNKIYIDVYTPYSKADINGFADLKDIADKFKNTIVNKQYDKFYKLLPNQLNGERILEINCAYHNDNSILLALTNGQYDIKGIVGIQMFYHDIAVSNKSHLIKFIPFP